ncbi:hypothetical protein J6590_011991 [Homalodisca vitripennis]|nr:hypothetical protein J6590_011991 [Homalodisca vitripennis]
MMLAPERMYASCARNQQTLLRASHVMTQWHSFYAATLSLLGGFIVAVNRPLVGVVREAVVSEGVVSYGGHYKLSTSGSRTSRGALCSSIVVWRRNIVNTQVASTPGSGSYGRYYLLVLLVAASQDWWGSLSAKVASTPRSGSYGMYYLLVPLVAAIQCWWGGVDCQGSKYTGIRKLWQVLLVSTSGSRRLRAGCGALSVKVASTPGSGSYGTYYLLVLLVAADQGWLGGVECQGSKYTGIRELWHVLLVSASGSRKSGLVGVVEYQAMAISQREKSNSPYRLATVQVIIVSFRPFLKRRLQGRLCSLETLSPWVYMWS